MIVDGLIFFRDAWEPPGSVQSHGYRCKAAGSVDVRHKQCWGRHTQVSWPLWCFCNLQTTVYSVTKPHSSQDCNHKATVRASCETTDKHISLGRGRTFVIMLISYGKQYQLDQNADQQLHLGFPQYASEGLAGIGALCKRTGLGMRFRIEAAAIATAIATATANQ